MARRKLIFKVPSIHVAKAQLFSRMMMVMAMVRPQPNQKSEHDTQNIPVTERVHD
jgi:hypothetical protein